MEIFIPLIGIANNLSQIEFNLILKSIQLLKAEILYLYGRDI